MTFSFKNIHASHIGIEGSIWQSREILYWPEMTAAIRGHVSACRTCNPFRMEQPKEPLMPQNVPERLWSKVAVDLFTLDIIIVDDYLNFSELRALSDTRASSHSVITSLKLQLVRHSIPIIVRSETFTREWDFEHITSSPYHARSNGKVENPVNTANKSSRKQSLTTRMPTSLYSTGGILQPKGSISCQYRH